MNTLLMLDLVVKSFALLLAAFALQSLWRNASAAQRSLIWLATFSCLLALPLSVLIEPQWTLTQRVAEDTQAVIATPLQAHSAALPVVNNAAAASTSKSAFVLGQTRFTWVGALIMLWLSGVLLVLGHRLLGAWQLRRLRAQSHLCRHEHITQLTSHRANSLGIRRLVQVRMSETIAVPVTWGVIKPVLLLPMDAHQWPEEALSAALLHELGHIRHFDAATRWLSTVVSALSWPNPLVWRAAGHWRMTQEQAADDLVLLTGASAHSYARQLLKAAHSLQQGGLLKASTLAMARPATLEKRLTTIMDSSRNRRHAGKGLRLTVTLTSVLVLTLLLSLRVQGESPKAPKSTDTTNESATDSNKLIAVEVKFVEAPAGRLPKEFHDNAVKTPSVPRLVTTLSTEALNKLLRPLFLDPAIKVISYPRMVTRNGLEVMFRSVQVWPQLPDGKPPPRTGQELKFLPVLHGTTIQL